MMLQLYILRVRPLTDVSPCPAIARSSCSSPPQRPRSPVRRRSPSLDRPAPYGVRIPTHILSQDSTEYREVERRHAK